MLRTIDVVQKNLYPQPCNVIVVGAGVSTQVIPDNTAVADEFAFISIQNLTGAELYYAFGQTCDNVSNYHGVLVDRGSLPIPHTGLVNVFSVAGGKVATTIFMRKFL